ncbi:class I SAM-dependent methyltransferase [Tahibacter amnicola]|uniref:Class I SAM-dependent methyltransferase n=1 Tax=Tahibacter amnicola TaxID=2976241 RepID=A0ABY6BA78_9GAMM|nr:class I SAM-dependent methyltransferase [Tahibacter amnicola]UXI66564.1 class I SAM-dependent methyltransferase [Tahibacter amnicola]
MSMTARLVALGVHYEDRAGRALQLPDATRAFAEAVTPSILATRALRQTLGWMEGLVLPGIAAHYVARKAWIWRVAEAAVRKGFARAVILAPGFDGLGVALHQCGVQVTELVHPDEVHPRRRLLGKDSPIEVRPADLARGFSDVADVLRNTSDTLWIAEAVLMYLPAEAVARLLRSVADVSGAQMLVFSAMTSECRGAVGFEGQSRWVNRLLRLSGEPFRWSLPDTCVRACARQHGYVAALVDGVASGGRCKGESLFCFERAGARLAAD